MRESLLSLLHPYSSINTNAARQDQEEAGKSKNRPGPTHRINWSQPLIWSVIDTTARSVGYPWSPVEIVRRLQQIDRQLFAALLPQRISQWRDHSHTSDLKWTEAHMRTVSHGNRSGIGERRGGIFVSVCFLLKLWFKLITLYSE
jgi:hypothetical protein